MVLVVGAMASGKRSYVLNELGYTAEQISDGLLDERPVLYNLQYLVEKDPSSCLSLLPLLLEKEVVVCNEVGSGVIPLSPDERAWREMAGRLCIELAQKADRVVRLVCGIPTVIKDKS